MKTLKSLVVLMYVVLFLGESMGQLTYSAGSHRFRLGGRDQMPDSVRKLNNFMLIFLIKEINLDVFHVHALYSVS